MYRTLYLEDLQDLQDIEDLPELEDNEDLPELQDIEVTIQASCEFADILRIRRHPTNSQTSYEFTDILRITCKSYDMNLSWCEPHSLLFLFSVGMV